MPQTLKFTQNSSVWVLQTYSFNKANKKKKNIHLTVNIFQPSSDKDRDLPSIFFKIGSLVKNFSKSKVKPKKTFIIVGFMYRKMGLLKYNVSPPKTEMIIPPTKGI